VTVRRKAVPVDETDIKTQGQKVLGRWREKKYRRQKFGKKAVGPTHAIRDGWKKKTLGEDGQLDILLLAFGRKGVTRETP